MTFGCWSDPAARASRRKRSRRSVSWASASLITLIATGRFRTGSVARYTTPIAPSPTRRSTSYFPILVGLVGVTTGSRAGPHEYPAIPRRRNHGGAGYYQRADS